MKHIINTIAIVITTLISVNVYGQEIEYLNIENYSYNEVQTINLPLASIYFTDEVQGILKPGCMVRINYNPTFGGDITCTLTLITPDGESNILDKFTSRILTLSKVKCKKGDMEYYNYTLKDRYDKNIFDIILMGDNINGYCLCRKYIEGVSSEIFKY